MVMRKKYRVAVDIGGTYVDAVCYNQESRKVHFSKSSTTPSNPVDGVMKALAGLDISFDEIDILVHGTTLGLNAILQRAGAKVGLITNVGFEDILEIGRAAVPPRYMYDYQYAPPPPLIPRRYRLGVPGRMNAEGVEVVPLDRDAVVAMGDKLVNTFSIDSIAVCFLHSYRNSIHELQAQEILQKAFPDVDISVSSDISREYGEFERTMTTVLDAYIRPIMKSYLDEFQVRLGEVGFVGRLQVMRSGGGAMDLTIADRAPLLTVLSGPAGGIAGARYLSHVQGWDKTITFDVGGTSLDTCVILNGEPGEVHEATIADLPVQIPVFDIRTIGAGGGSIARFDDGILRVGPESAGAVPGPVCYGKGGIHPTITDALLTLGFLNPDNFLGGKVQVFPKLASDAIRDDVGNYLNLEIQESAVRMIQILVAKTVGAVREITLERGLDPREFLLVAFGGAGPVLAPLVGLEMGMNGVVVPALPGAFSALGMLMTDLEFDYSSTVLEVLIEASLANLESVVEGLHQQAKEMFQSQGIFEGEYEVKVRYDLRYEGQEHSISVPVEHGDTAEALEERFGSMHYERFGHRMNEQCEVSSVRLKVISEVEKPEFMRVDKDSSTPTPGSKRRAYDFSESMIRDFDIYLRDDLRYGAVIPGPAVIEESASATVFFSDQVAIVDELGQIIIRNKKDKA